MNTEWTYLTDIHGYNFITANRKSKICVGVGMYIAENIEYKVREDLSIIKENILESLFIEMKADPVVIAP